MTADGNEAEPWEASTATDARGPVRGPWIIAASIVAAAVIVSLTIASLHDDRPALPISAALGSAPLGATSAEQVYQDAQTRAQDRAAQSDLRLALVVAKTIYTDNSTYAWADASADGMVTVDSSLCYVEANSTSSTFDAYCGGGASISIFASDDAWAAARMSNSGACFCIKDDATAEGPYGFGATTYGSGFPCTGTAATQAGESTW